MQDIDNHEEMTALFGPLYPYSEHHIGDSIHFNLRGQEVLGEITWITGPSTTVQGRHAPVTYICAVDGEMTPTLVYPGEIV